MIGLGAGLAKLRAGLLPARLDADVEEVLADLERRLLEADAGTATARELVTQVRARLDAAAGQVDIAAALRAVITELLQRLAPPPAPPQSIPHVVLMAGTNGSGKTTTVAKLARQAAEQGQQVVLAASDTFRAAAADQLQVLAERLGDKVRVVSDKDPGATAYNAVTAAAASKADVVLIDTAGRQPTSKALMAEVVKIDRAVGKALPGAPHERILALDANTGQNALRQLEVFDEALGLSGLVVTKLDAGSRGGGVILAIAATRSLPLRYVGVGEGVDDLLLFDPAAFAAALFA